MAVNHGIHVKQLGKHNFNTWKIQVTALLVKNKVFGYVNGQILRPRVTITNATASIVSNQINVDAWDFKDAIESHVNLPGLEDLQIKIYEESASRA